jgi:hypothetical protein
MPNLAETQEIFWRLISAPEGVARGLADLPDRERRLPGGLARLVRGDERLDAVERLDIYAEMYFFRLLDCLAEDFPAIHTVIGHQRFHQLAGGYLAAHPSEHFSLRQLGRRVADFLERHPLSPEWFFLPDLARFEWALLEAFDAPDADPLPAERLKELPAEEWAAARFRLTPSLRVLEASADVRQVWTAANEKREITPPAPRPTTIRIWRQDLRVFHRTIDPLELAALREVESGRDFAAVCEAAASLVGEEEVASRVVAVLQRWFADGMVVAVKST